MHNNIWDPEFVNAFKVSNDMNNANMVRNVIETDCRIEQ